jgi:hypothetical protein
MLLVLELGVGAGAAVVLADVVVVGAGTGTGTDDDVSGGSRTATDRCGVAAPPLTAIAAPAATATAARATISAPRARCTVLTRAGSGPSGTGARDGCHGGWGYWET